MLAVEQGRSDAAFSAAGPSGSNRAPPVLLVFIEPAPYVVAFVNAARQIWPSGIDVVYIGAKMTQEWGYQAHHDDAILPSGLLNAFLEIKRRIDSGRYGLIHLAGWGHPLLWSTLLYARGRIAVSVETDTPARHFEKTWKRLVKRAVYPRLFKIPAVFTPAGTAQASYLQSFGVDSPRIKIAQFTSDIEQFAKFSSRFTPEDRRLARAPLGWADHHVAILYVGRLEAEKGIEDLLDAFDLASRQLPDIRLLIAGDGALKGKVLRFGRLRRDVVYFGRVSGEALYRTYNIADLFVLPSRSESWGLVVNEAMAADLSTIVSERAGCIPDLVQHGVTGFVARAENPQALCDALLEVARDGELRKRVGAAAKQLISHWTIENQASNVTQAWLSVLQPTRPARSGSREASPDLRGAA